MFQQEIGALVIQGNIILERTDLEKGSCHHFGRPLRFRLMPSKNTTVQRKEIEWNSAWV